MTDGTLVDSNVLLDLITDDAEWVEWSGEQLALALDRGPVLINEVIFSEVSLGFSTVEALDATLSGDRFVRANLPWSAAFLAARVHRSYRARGGNRPDFDVAGLLHRRTRRCGGPEAAHTGCVSIPDLLPDRGAHHALKWCCFTRVVSMTG